MVKARLNTPFQRGHDVKYGLAVTERDDCTNKVQAVSCLFCMRFGREPKPGAKRKRTTNVRVFHAPFRTDSYRRHLVLAHPQQWKVFEQCSKAEKATFFDGVANQTNIVMPSRSESEGALMLTFNRDIVEVIIGNLLFDPVDEETQCTREKALAVFKPFEDAVVRENASDAEQDLNRDVYRVKISSVRRFKMVLGFISMGASFRSASRFVDVARETYKSNFLAECSRVICATYTRIICAGSLQALYEILRDCWAYSIALNVGHALGTSYMDLRIRLCTKHGKLSNVHVIAIPLNDNKTTEAQFNLCCQVLDVIDPDWWRSKLLSVGSDGEPTVDHRISDVQTRFEQAVKHPIVRVGCGLHQLDLLVQREYESLCDDTFMSTLTSLIAYLLRQNRLQMEMATTCPKLVSTRWLSMKRVTSWLRKHRVRVVEYLVTKKPVCTPTNDWWIVLLCLDSVATALSHTASSLQDLSTFLAQQDAQLKALGASLSKMCRVSGPLSTGQIAALNFDTALRRGKYSVAFADAKTFIKDQGTFAIDTMAAIPPSRAEAITCAVANLFAGLYGGIIDIVASQNSHNQSSANVLPPVLPHSLAAIRTSDVCEMIRLQRCRLEKAGWSAAQIDQIEDDHRELRHWADNEVQFREILSKCSDGTTGFVEGWRLCHGRFDKLRQFAGGLATMFPNTATGQEDFSIIEAEKNVRRHSLTDFSLEGILHAKQFEALRSMAAE